MGKQKSTPKTIYIFENTINKTNPKRETRRYSTTARLHLHLRELSISRKGKIYKVVTQWDPSTPPTPPHQWEEKNQSREGVEAQDY